jgi:hypothetical protein
MESPDTNVEDAPPRPRRVNVEISYAGKQLNDVVLSESFWIGPLKQLIRHWFEISEELDIIITEQRQRLSDSCGDKKLDFFKISTSPDLQEAIAYALERDKTLQLKVSTRVIKKVDPKDLVNVELINHIDVSFLGAPAEDNDGVEEEEEDERSKGKSKIEEVSNKTKKNKKPVMMVVGGVHGNERMGVRGAQMLVDYLKRAPVRMREGCDLGVRILSALQVVVVPCINPVGYSADARCCPTTQVREVTFTEGKVVVAEDEKGSIKPPTGWADPNRGWQGKTNDTLVKHHLKRLLRMISPSVIVFNHDWALPQGKVKIYGAEECLAKVAGVQLVFERVYPSSLGGMGGAWSFLEMFAEVDKVNMCYPLFEQAGITNYLVESSWILDESPRIHVAVTLYLLARTAGLADSDTELVATIWREVAALPM